LQGKRARNKTIATYEQHFSAIEKWRYNTIKLPNKQYSAPFRRESVETLF
jgi:hypothetical protein